MDHGDTNSPFNSWAYALYNLILNEDTLTFDARDCDYCDQTSTYGTDYIAADIYIRYWNDSVKVRNAESGEFELITGTTIRVEGNDRKNTEEIYTSCYGVPSAPTNLSYTTNGSGNPVLLWGANTERDLKQYRIYRYYIEEGTVYLGATPYNTYTDETFWVAPVEEYQYWVKAEDWGGNLSSSSNVITINGYAAKKLVQNLPDHFILHDSYPNPFNPKTTIKYDLPEESTVSIVIFNFLGREVCTLLNFTIDAGFYQVVWDGKDNAGKAVASGMYILLIKAQGLESGDGLKSHQ